MSTPYRSASVSPTTGTFRAQSCVRPDAYSLRAWARSSVGVGIEVSDTGNSISLSISTDDALALADYIMSKVAPPVPLPVPTYHWLGADADQNQ